MIGTIKRVIEGKGFGFIRGENDKEYFAHATGCFFPLNEMHVGKQVEFENIDNAPKGPRAENVVLKND